MKMKNLLLFTLVASVGLLLSCGKDDIKISPLSLAFSETEATVSEDADPVTVTLTFPKAELAASVSLTISGTAVYGTDYTTNPAVEADQIMFDVEKDQTSISFTFTPLDNDDYNEAVTVIASLEEATGIVLGDNTSYTITIEDDGDLSNETIDLGDGQKFNMKNFIHSFEQIFNEQDHFAYAMDHTTDAGLVTDTEHYDGIYAGFGFADDYYLISHTFENGAITSSDRVTLEDEEAGIASTSCGSESFEYTFDDEGYIVGLALYDWDGDLENEISYTYNDAKQLVSRIGAGYDDREKRLSGSRLRSTDQITGIIVEPIESTETFTYNTDGTIASYERSESEYWEYTYTSGLMTYAEGYDSPLDSEPLYTEEYDYSASGLVEEVIFEDLDFGQVYAFVFEYGASEVTINEYSDGSISDRTDVEEGFSLIYTTTYKKGGILTSETEYYYDSGCIECCLDCLGAEPLEVLDFAVRSVYGDPTIGSDGCDYLNYQVEAKEYYEGTAEALDLIGYAVIESRTNNKKAMESVYDGDDVLLFTLDFSADPGDYCDVVITDEVNDATVTMFQLEVGVLAVAPWYEELFPNNSFCEEF